MSAKRLKRSSKTLVRRERTEVDTAESASVFRQGEMFPAAILEQRTRFSGPLPPPGLLDEYELVLPGLAGRIVAMAEAEGEHRRRLQRRVVRLSEAGLASAFIIAMTVVVGGFFLIHEGSSREGVSSVLGGLATLLVVYLARGRKPQPRREAPAS
jgi:uncharacterized membrane protein